MSVAIDLEGSVAVVSGASSGIGAEVARRLATAGAAVVISGRSADRAEIVRAGIAAQGGTASVVLGDVTSSGDAESIIGQAVADHGRLDVLVNAAGLIFRGDAIATSDEDWHRVMRANLDGTFYLSRAALAPMRASGGGSIINVSSTCGLVGSASLLAYCASKGAVTNLTRAMALDHVGDGIRVNAVCPGGVDTPMLYAEHAVGVDAADVRSQNIDAIPQGRLATDREVADLAVFLASDLSSHLVGANISIDGGYAAQ